MVPSRFFCGFFSVSYKPPVPPPLLKQKMDSASTAHWRFVAIHKDKKCSLKFVQKKKRKEKWRWKKNHEKKNSMMNALFVHTQTKKGVFLAATGWRKISRTCQE